MHDCLDRLGHRRGPCAQPGRPRVARHARPLLSCRSTAASGGSGPADADDDVLARDVGLAGADSTRSRWTRRHPHVSLRPRAPPAAHRQPRPLLVLAGVLVPRRGSARPLRSLVEVLEGGKTRPLWSVQPSCSTRSPRRAHARPPHSTAQPQALDSSSPRLSTPSMDRQLSMPPRVLGFCEAAQCAGMARSMPGARERERRGRANGRGA